MSIVAPIAATGVCDSGHRRDRERRPSGVDPAARDRRRLHRSRARRAARPSTSRVARRPGHPGQHRARTRRRARLRQPRRRAPRRRLAPTCCGRLRPRVASASPPFWASSSVRRPPPEREPVAYGVLLLMGVLDLAANGLYALATRHGLLSIVAVAASQYPLVTVLLARAVLARAGAPDPGGRDRRRGRRGGADRRRVSGAGRTSGR